MKILIQMIVLLYSSWLLAYDKGTFVYKVCNYAVLPAQEKIGLLSHALNVYCPEDLRHDLITGFSNFSLVNKEMGKSYTQHCQTRQSPVCQKIIQKTQTLFQYDLGTQLARLESLVLNNQRVISAVKAICPKFDESINDIKNDLSMSLDYSELIKQGKFSKIDQMITQFSRNFNIQLSDKRQYVIIEKEDAGSSILETREQGPCITNTKSPLNPLDVANFMNLEFLQKSLGIFAPTTPKEFRMVK